MFGHRLAMRKRVAAKLVRTVQEGKSPMRRLFVLFCLSAVACGGGGSTPTTPANAPPPAPTTASLSGRVETPSAVPVGGATVTVSDGSNAGRTSTTDGNGHYQLTGLQRGGFNVNVSATGHVTAGFSIDLVGDLTRNFVVATVPPPAPPSVVTLSGRVTSTSEAPVSGATLAVSDGANAGRTTTSDQIGNYQFTALQSGGLSLRISANGFNTATVSIDLDGDLTRDFVLVATPPGQKTSGRR